MTLDISIRSLGPSMDVFPLWSRLIALSLPTPCNRVRTLRSHEFSLCIVRRRASFRARASMASLMRVSYLTQDYSSEVSQRAENVRSDFTGCNSKISVQSRRTFSLWESDVSMCLLTLALVRAVTNIALTTLLVTMLIDHPCPIECRKERDTLAILGYKKVLASPGDDRLGGNVLKTHTRALSIDSSSMRSYLCFYFVSHAIASDVYLLLVFACDTHLFTRAISICHSFCFHSIIDL